MSEGEAEKKRIARLDFDVNDAITNLDKVASKLEKISKKSDSSFKNIEKNFDKVFTGGDSARQISEIDKRLKNVEKLSQKSNEKLKAKAIKDKMDIEKYEQKAAIKSKLMAEEILDLIDFSATF